MAPFTLASRITDIAPARRAEFEALHPFATTLEISALRGDGLDIALRKYCAAVFALSRLPLTAWFALPALLLPAVRRARR